MFAKTFVAAAALAGLASAQEFNAGDGLVTTTTILTTQEITVTSCGPDVTVCPGKVVLTTFPIVTTLPGVVTTLPGAVVPVDTKVAVVAPAPVPDTKVAVIVNPTGAVGTGIVCPGCVPGATTYNVPKPTAGGDGVDRGDGTYSGPDFTGAASKLSAVGGVAAVGAVMAAILL